ncbi:tyrosine--tRNA ligase ['Camptotheca acuminata' phytoplasma]|uniref:tyrosine--tRNA ligase n=1 Tax='Camptotheca acuminata' phytoplasma TaxID=3239192 RepID=UPI00351A0933
MFLFEELKWRNLIKDVSDEKQIETLLNEGKIAFYCGFDPTAISLTIGHLIQIVTISLLQKRGHHPFVLLGKATSLIGDPKEKEERKLLSLKDVSFNYEKIKDQLKKLLPKENIDFVDNYEWISKIDVISFLRDYGKYFNVNYMISKDKIAKRLTKGISYTEFSYMILQSIDFHHLYKNHEVQLQLGGSDQWGNITSGLELIRKMESNNEDKNTKKPLGMSMILLLDDKGNKIGKSDNNAVWLDQKLTTPYRIYQFFLNTEDKNVVSFLKRLTLLEVEEIIKLEEMTQINPKARLAQKELAKQVVTLVHGSDVFQECLLTNDILFSKKTEDLKIEDFTLIKKRLFSVEIDKPILLLDALVQTKLADSKKKAKTLILSGAIKIFKKTIKEVDFYLDSEQTLFQKYILLTKKNKINALIIFRS